MFFRISFDIKKLFLNTTIFFTYFIYFIQDKTFWKVLLLFLYKRESMKNALYLVRHVHMLRSGRLCCLPRIRTSGS